MVEFDFDSEELMLKLQAIRKKAVRLSMYRLGVFFGMAAVLILGLAEHPIWFAPGILAAWFFIKLVGWYNFQKDQEAIYLSLQKMGDQADKRIKRTLSGLDSGSEYSEKNHPFSSDLDLFGDHSLFQLLNHTVSKGGKDRLASLMKRRFDREESTARAEAVSELAGKHLFLQAMEASGLAFRKDEISGKWTEWLGQPEKSSSLYRLLSVAGPVGGVSLLVLVFMGIIPEAALGIWILTGVGLLSRIFHPLKAAAEAIPSATTLQSFLVRTELIEKEDFLSSALRKEKAALSGSGVGASVLLRELDQLGLWAQNRINLLYLPINLLFWTDFLLFIRLSAWKNRVGQSLSHLPENLENWEVWVSLGAFESELEGSGKFDWTDGVGLSGQDLTHPLIAPGKAIGNSVDFDPSRKIVILTGANMSGKTTFMRTLGINCVLGNLGLSPFGKSLTLGPIQLYTSMRNSDNLGESVSSFYAELSRIHQLIERLESGEPLFFLLDEILKGTNTQDRVSGSEALILQILKTKGFGIISTHDIELSSLEKSVEKVINYSFHSEILDQTIHFDYKIKNGPCPSFNAHKLMELMGIKFQN
ncbi:DNA mismatch repair protein [Algoriphagus lacus]|uniref:DNA mismatch repair protein n=1 Tax=Algoriphagus lacus TaxID=2056311 RepID=A0A418PWR5_9BACT|nr:DNA mismatch repair protein [Algoriphagus lacus]RIW18513.1 DNA mismatch repair protein [Algoriphagus lacus]